MSPMIRGRLTWEKEEKIGQSISQVLDLVPVAVSRSVTEEEPVRGLQDSDPSVCELPQREHQESNSNNNVDWGAGKVSGPSLWDAIQTVEL